MRIDFAPTLGFRPVRKTITFDGGVGSGAVASPGLTWFTVTNEVIVELIVGTVDTLMVSTADTGTISLGITGAGTFIIAATTVGSGTFATGALWIDASPSTTAEIIPAGNKLLLLGANVVSNIVTNAITQGALTITVWWKPAGANGLIVPA